MAPDLLDTILTSYQWPQPLRTDQIHNGTHRVYRAYFGASHALGDIAIKVSRRTDPAALRAKRIEHDVLVRVGDTLDFVPRLVPPRDTGADAQCFPWGIADRSGRIISCYYWRDGVRYRNQARQLMSVAHAYKEIRRALSTIDAAGFAQPDEGSEQRFLTVDGILTLDKGFGFADLNVASGALLRQHLPFLEQEIQRLRDLVASTEFPRHFSGLDLLHLELSPSNFGFYPDGTVSSVFDFDSMTPGVWLHELAWLVNTFCIDYRKSLADTTAPLGTLLDALLRHGVLNRDTLNGYLLPFMRLAYLDSIYRKLNNAYLGRDSRMGFLKEDVKNLLWLRTHDGALRMHFEARG